MNLLQLKKWKNLIMVCIGALALCACSSDEEEWELAETSVTFGSVTLDAFGGKKVIKISTNTYWEIMASTTNVYGNDKSDWITFDKTSGVGDAEIIATIPRYESGDSRSKNVVIKTGRYTKEGSKKTVNNVAGGNSETWLVRQYSIDALLRESLNISITNVKAWSHYVINVINGYWNYTYTTEGTADCEISYNTNDQRIIDLINGMITSVEVEMKFKDGWYNTNYTENHSIPFEIGTSKYELSYEGGADYDDFYITVSVKLNDGTEIKDIGHVEFEASRKY